MNTRKRVPLLLATLMLAGATLGGCSRGATAGGLIGGTAGAAVGGTEGAIIGGTAGAVIGD